MEKMEGLKSCNEPRDTYKIAYIIHFFLGAGNLLPWNAFITAIDYFSYLYPGNHVEKVFSIAYMSSAMLVLVLMTSWSAGSRRVSLRTRMNIGLSMFVLSLMAVPLIDWVWCSDVTQERPPATYILTVASVVVCGLADGLNGGSLIGAAGNLPKQYMQAVFAGTASSGVVVCILRIITKASLPQNTRGLRTSAHLYFIVGIAILLCCILCSNLLFMLPKMQQLYKSQKDEQPSSRRKIWNTATKISRPAFGIFLTYVITLSIFPGFIADNQQSKVLQGWYPILLISAYNVSDLAGKCSTALYTPNSIGKSAWASAARLLFYPLFAACLHGPMWLKTELPMVLLTVMLGISNGYLTSVLMILTPKSVENAEAEAAAIVMAVSLGLGLLGGSVFGWLWVI